MAVYEYTALSEKGRKVKGHVDAESVRAARVRLKKQGIYPTTLEESQSKKVSKTKDVGAYFQRQGVSSAALGIVTRQLATLSAAGMPLVEALKNLADQVDQPRLKTVIASIADRVNEGSTFAESIRQHPKVFPPLYGNMVASGEASGTLDLVLERLADLLETDAQLKRKVLAALAYPVLMMILCFGVVILLLAYVVPKLTVIFEEHKAALPLPTEIVIAASDFVKSYWWLIFALIVGSVVLFNRYAATKLGRIKIDGMKLRLPLIGPLLTKVAAARFSQTLGTMLSSGVELLSALNIVKNIVGNVVLKEAIEHVSEGVREGKGLSRELERTKLFPRLLTQMVSIGERTGQLDKMLLRAASNYESELNAIVAGLTAILNPILILFLAGVVGMILISVMLPMLEMTSLVK